MDMKLLKISIELRRRDSNSRHLGYEPSKLPLLHSAMKFVHLSKHICYSCSMGQVGLEPTMPEGHGFTARCVTNSAHQPIISIFITILLLPLLQQKFLTSSLGTVVFAYQQSRDSWIVIRNERGYFIISRSKSFCQCGILASTTLSTDRTRTYSILVGIQCPIGHC